MLNSKKTEMSNQKLTSKYFSLNEFLRSQTASRLNITEQFNPPPTVVKNLQLLVDNVLDPLREAIGEPIIISSGYRCPKLNASIPGSSKTSQHMTGEAADIEATGLMTNADLFRKIQELNLPFDQMIWEFGTKQNPAWIHVSFSSRHRRQILHIS